MDNQQNQNQPTAPMQPVAMQPSMQPMQQQNVQYVVMQKSLEGIGGWLIFWLILFSLFAIGSVTMFFSALVSEDISTAEKVVTLLFTPLLAIGFTASVVYIAMQKKLAKLITLISLGVCALYGITNLIVAYVSPAPAGSYYASSQSSSYQLTVPGLISAILVNLLIFGLISLYFILSKRVKATLVK